MRLETMIQLSGVKIEEKAMRQMISSSINIIIQLARLSDGSRRLISLSEITGMESGVITMQDVFVFNRQAAEGRGQVAGSYAATGVRPKFAERCQMFGVPLPNDIFEPRFDSGW
jgi:pilus assembly protein CpaF